jgi:hypothetical protein
MLSGRSLPTFQRYFLPPPWLITLMMEAESTSETLVNFYQTTRRYDPEDSYLRAVVLLRAKTHPPFLEQSLFDKRRWVIRIDKCTCNLCISSLTFFRRSNITDSSISNCRCFAIKLGNSCSDIACVWSKLIRTHQRKETRRYSQIIHRSYQHLQTYINKTLPY